MNKLPSGWQHKSVGEVAEFITTGKTPPTQFKDYFGGAILWFTPADVGVSKNLSLTERTLTKKAILERKAVLFPKDTLLITCIGNIGRVGIITRDGSTNQQITGIKFKANIDVNYAYYWFRNNSHRLVYKANKAIVPILNNSQLREIKIEYPSLPIQKQIAEILEKADQAKQKRREADKLTEQFLQSAFIEMFGDPVRNPKGWEVRCLSEYFVIEPQNGIYKHSSEYGSGTRILRIDSFYDGKIYGIEKLKRVKVSSEEIQKYGLIQNNIVINRVNSREYLGKCGLIPLLEEPMIFESNMMRFSVDDRIHPVYLTKLLTTDFMKGQILKVAKDAVNQSSINQEDVKNFQVLIPPINLQQQFAKLVQKTEKLKEKQKESEVELENLFNSLMQKAFKGELE